MSDSSSAPYKQLTTKNPCAIKGVFFDLGGTLRICHENPEHQQKARLRMAELAGWKDPDALQALIQDRYDNQYRVWALGENRESGDYELWAKWLLPELPEAQLKAICHEMTFQYRQVKGKRSIVEGGLEVIQTLHARGFKLGILSNLIGENEIPDWLEADHLRTYFDTVILSSVCHIRKPDPRVYLMGCEELGLKPQECASVADNLNRDITGARRAGIGLNILFISEEKLAKKVITEENQPDFIVHSFRDVLQIPSLGSLVCRTRTDTREE